MSYESISQAAQDPVLRSRIAACVAQEDHSGNHPLATTDLIQWRCAAEPGWGEAWESAVAGSVEVPGSDPGVISDAMILAAVQKQLGINTAEE
jgi:hypothetical protein